jgi:hypothetical protein
VLAATKALTGGGAARHHAFAIAALRRAAQSSV